MAQVPNHPRIVSLVPSATEIIGLLGAAPWLVGRSHECDYPAEVRTVPVLTGQTTAPAAPTPTPAEIDRQVRKQLATGVSLYRLDERLLAQLAPDIIFTQDLCLVCSIDLSTVRRLAESLHPRPMIVSLNPTTFDGVLDDVLAVGAALGLQQRAAEEVVRLRERTAAAEDFVNRYEDGPNIAFLEWTDPIFIGGHWTVQLIERAGARHPLNPTAPLPDSGAASGSQQAQRTAGKSLQITSEVLAASRPDRIIICPCGLDLAQARRAAAELAGAPWFRSLPASQSGHVAIVDGNQMFNRPGPRLVDAFEWLVGWLHGRPQLIPGGFPWEPANR